MDAVEYLISKGLVEGDDFKLVSGGREVLTRCKSCPPDKEPKCYINRYTGAWQCKRCESAGLIKDGSEPTLQMSNKLDDSSAHTVVSSHYFKQDYIDTLHKLLCLPLGSTALQYLTQARKLDTHVLTQAKIGFDPNRNCIVIPNLDLDGDAVGLKYRQLDPNAEPRYYQESLGGMKQLPYNIAHLDKSNDTLHITEGEIDALSILTLTPEVNVIALPGKDAFPASKRDDSVGLLSFLEPFKHVYLYPDNEIRARLSFNRLAGLLGANKCHLVSLPQGVKDVNEYLVKGAERSELEQLQRNAVRAKGRAYVTGADLFDPSMAKLKETKTVAKFSTGLPALDNVMDYLRPGELTLIAGDPKSGKSTISFQVAHDVLKQGVPTIIASLEMDIHTNIMPRMLSQAYERNLFDKGANLEGIKLPRYFERLLYVNPDQVDPRVSAIRASVSTLYGAQKLQSEPIVFMVLDNLTNLRPPQALKMSERFEWVGEQVGELKQLTREFPNLHIFLICHLRKREQGGSISKGDIRGSMAIQAECDNILLVTQTEDGSRLHSDGIRWLTGEQRAAIDISYNRATTRISATSIESEM